MQTMQMIMNAILLETSTGWVLNSSSDVQDIIVLPRGLLSEMDQYFVRTLGRAATPGVPVCREMVAKTT
jgi:hypothetical protein